MLGAARIVKHALVDPAMHVEGIEIAALASRDLSRAKASARRHHIPQSFGSYEALLEDPSIDAVYIPLPAALHAEWTIAAAEAGKHVLCEKPFTSNSDAAQRVAIATADHSVVVMEAYHSHYHPLHKRLSDIIESGELGTVTEANASFCTPIPPGSDIRWNPKLGGGGLLDVGYYPVRQLRVLFGEIDEVENARAWQRNDVDRLLVTSLRFAASVRAQVVSSIGPVTW